MKKLIALAFIILLSSCGSDNSSNSGNSSKDGFDRKSMLTFWANDIIVPGYKQLAETSTKMTNTIDVFIGNPTIANLQAAKSSWQKAYISWQKVSLFQIGKAQSENLAANMNTYPTTISKIEEYVAKDYDFSSPNLVDIQGFPALDYLLYGVKDSEEAVVAFYKKDTNYSNYLKNVSKRVASLSALVYNDWATNGYAETFINNDGNTTTSSVDKVVNYFVIPFYEKQLREYKIVIPAGARTGKPLPAYSEAFYAKNLSKELFLTTLQATVNFFNGTAYNGTTKGKSLQQYLEFLDRKDLVKVINAKLENVSNLSSKLENDFTQQVNNDEDRKKFLAVFDALQTVLKSFKPDMMSAMSIQNTSTDTDND